LSNDRKALRYCSKHLSGCLQIKARNADIGAGNAGTASQGEGLLFAFGKEGRGMTVSRAVARGRCWGQEKKKATGLLRRIGVILHGAVAFFRGGGLGEEGYLEGRGLRQIGVKS